MVGLRPDSYPSERTGSRVGDQPYLLAIVKVVAFAAICMASGALPAALRLRPGWSAVPQISMNHRALQPTSRRKRRVRRLAAIAASLLVAGCRATSREAQLLDATSLVVADSAARDTAATIDIRFEPREEALPGLWIELDDGTSVRVLRAADLPRMEGGNAWQTSFLIPAPDTTPCTCGLPS